MSGILQFASIIIPWLAQVAQDEDVKAFVLWGYERVSDMIAGGSAPRDPTEAEWDELNARIARLRLKLHSDTE